jgi:hypothetical protein
MSMGFASHITQPSELYIQFLKNRHFDDIDIQQLGLELLDKDKTKSLLGHTAEWSIKIPYFDVDGNDTGFVRVRLLQPKTKMKYSQARSSGSHIYFPPTVNWRTILNNVDIPLIITEGEFKTWAITKAIGTEQLGHACIGLAGVTSWTSKKSTQLHPDLMQFMWQKKSAFETKHRKVMIVFDYDGAKDDGEPNEQVAFAETKLAVTLRGLGAEVHLCRVGKFSNGKGAKYAIDDHLAAGGTLGTVLATTSVVMNGVDTLDVRLHEFATKYALYNGDVIRLDDGHIMPFHKAKVDSAQHVFIQQLTVPGRGTQPPRVTSREIMLLEEYKKWRKRCDIRKVGVFPQYQGLKITPDGNYNYLSSWSHDAVDGDPALYLDFCTYFFRDEPAFADYWHDWVANVVQHPYRRNNTTPQFVSNIEGIGKSAVAEFIAEMLGLGEHGPAIIIGPDELFGSFNGIFKNKILIVINEPSSDREDHSAQLKSMITGKEIAINNKYGAQYNIENYMNFIFTSNKPYITKMGNNARREAIYKPASLTNIETHPLVVNLMSWARHEKGFGKVLNWYYNRDISHFDPSKPAPDTKYKQVAIQAGRSPIEAFAKELNDWVLEKLDGHAAFTPAQLEILCERWGHDSRAKVQYIKKALLNYMDIESKLIKHSGKTSRYSVCKVTSQKVADRDLDKYGALGQLATDTETAVKQEIESF